MKIILKIIVLPVERAVSPEIRSLIKIDFILIGGSKIGECDPRRKMIQEIKLKLSFEPLMDIFVLVDKLILVIRSKWNNYIANPSEKSPALKPGEVFPFPLQSDFDSPARFRFQFLVWQKRQ